MSCTGRSDEVASAGPPAAAGEGANLAMYDGADLAAELVEQSDTEAALTAYEQRLFPRSSDAASRSAQNLEVFFGREAPHSVVTLFDRDHRLCD